MMIDFGEIQAAGDRGGIADERVALDVADLFKSHKTLIKAGVLGVRRDEELVHSVRTRELGHEPSQFHEERQKRAKLDVKHR